MEVVTLQPMLEPTFWRHITQDVPDYFFFALDWKYNKDDTEILMVLEENRIQGLMLVYKRSIVQLRGSNEAGRALLELLDLEKVELTAEKRHIPYIIEKYKPIKSHELMLMVLDKGDVSLQIKHPVMRLNASHAEQVATIMRGADPEYWGYIQSQHILEGIDRGSIWFGIKVDGELVSITSARSTEWCGLIGVVATREEHRNRGYATSLVSETVKKILEKQSRMMIYVLNTNEPAKRVYSKIGFKPYKTYYFMTQRERR